MLRTASGAPDVVVLPGLGALPYLRPLVRGLARRHPVAVLEVPEMAHLLPVIMKG